MTKHKEKEEDIIKQRDMKKEVEKDLPGEISQSESDEGAISQEEEIEEVVDKTQEYLNNWKRAVADFENYKKQQAENQKEFARFANVNLMMQILPVIDNFYASTGHIPEEQKNNPWVVGIMHIQKQLEQVLRDNGVDEIEVKEGDEFDPNVHEAVGDMNDANRQPNDANKISKILSKGYRIDGKVIRAAKVIVN